MRARPGVAFAAAMIAALTAACDEAPVAPALDSLELSVAVDPDQGIAGDDFDVLVTVMNPEDRAITLTGRAACVVSAVRVFHDTEGHEVHFLGSGEQSCSTGELRVPADDSVVLRIPLTAWEEPGPDTSPWMDGPPFPTLYRIEVTSEVLESGEGTFWVARSGLYSGYGTVCDSTPSGPEPIALVTRPRVLEDALIRLRFEIHNLSQDPTTIYFCSGGPSVAVDRRAPGGDWEMGEFLRTCDSFQTGWFPLPPGGCYRSMRWAAWEPLFEYRVRAMTPTDTLVSDPFIP